MLIGFCGHKGVGKDTAAQFLIDRFDFTRIAFADKLKEAVANLFDIDVRRVDAWKDWSGLTVGVQHDKTLMARHSWREFLQRFGTEMGRNTFGQNFWVEQWKDAWVALSVLDPDAAVNIVAPDVRFQNEAVYIKNAEGYIVEIVREGYEPDGHASEEPLPRNFIDAQIINNGTLNELEVDVYELYKGLERQHVS